MEIQFQLKIIYRRFNELIEKKENFIDKEKIAESSKSEEAILDKKLS